MRPTVMVVLDVAADLFSSRDLIEVITHKVNLLLLDRPINPDCAIEKL